MLKSRRNMICSRIFMNGVFKATIILIAMIRGAKLNIGGAKRNTEHCNDTSVQIQAHSEQQESECACISEAEKGYIINSLDNNTNEIKDLIKTTFKVRQLTDLTKDIDKMLKQVQNKLETIEQRMTNFLDKKSLDELYKKVEKMQKDTKKIEGMVEEEKNFRENLKRELGGKLESVESTNREIEGRLEEEKRLRTKLQDNVVKAEKSLVSVEDQLTRVIASRNEIGTALNSTINDMKDMKRTIFEDHLPKLYNEVNGVAYRNETRKLEERIENIDAEISEGLNSSTFRKLVGNVITLEGKLCSMNSFIDDNLVNRMMQLESETVRKGAAMVLEKKVNEILESTEKLEKDLFGVQSDIQDFRGCVKKFQNFSTECIKSIEDLQIQMGELENKTASKFKKDDVTSFLNDDNDLSAHTHDICSIPHTDNLHLLIDVETQPNGTQKLIFGCRPVGEYEVSSPAVAVTCQGGTWKGQLPTCHKLPLPDEVGSHQFIPPIQVPGVDKPNGKLWSGPGGELIVDALSNFTLKCLYPKGREHGWQVEHSDHNSRRWPSYTFKDNGNKYILKVYSAVKEDSGKYTCITSSGRHSIKVVVRDNQI